MLKQRSRYKLLQESTNSIEKNLLVLQVAKKFLDFYKTHSFRAKITFLESEQTESSRRTETIF
jgi:hypothetical protein